MLMENNDSSYWLKIVDFGTSRIFKTNEDNQTGKNMKSKKGTVKN